jgi:hypothetical protein
VARLVDEVVVVDDHITGVLTEHQAGRCLDMRRSGMKACAGASPRRALLPGGQPRHRLGRHRHRRPAAIIEGWDAEAAWPGLRLLMVSTTGEHAAWYVLDEHLQPRAARCPPRWRGIVERIGENCEPSLCTVLFVAAPAAACAPASPRTRCC